MHLDRFQKSPGLALERGQVVYAHPELADAVTTEDQRSEPLGVVAGDAAAEDATVLVSVGATPMRACFQVSDSLISTPKKG